MATLPHTPTTPPSQSILSPEPSKMFLNFPDADIILRSCDSLEFRVLKLYILKSSPILRKQIQAISGPSYTTISTDHGASEASPALPVLRMSDNGAILTTFLTFIFPVPAVLPPTLEEIMELLSIAQKYEMPSVLDHIRGKIALSDPPFIRPENAFHAYSLAQKYGLLPESARAAKATLRFTLTIEDQEENLDVMPGAHLHKLWKFHKGVQSNLLSTIKDFRGSAAHGTLNGLQCVSICPWGIPKWLDDYIFSIAGAPSFFDPIEFQLAFVRHTIANRCSWCAKIPSNTIRTFWTALTKFFNGNVAKAELELTLSIRRVIRLEPKLSSREHSHPPMAVQPLPESMFTTEADIIIQSSDLVKFPVHKSILACSSQFFRDMFTLPQPPEEATNELTVLRVSEDAELVRALITLLYPIPSEIPVSYDRVLALLTASQKYDMPAIRFSIRSEISSRKLTAQTGDQAFRAYAISSRNGLSPETATSAHLTLNFPLTFESIGSELQQFEGWALRDLARFRKSRRDDIVSCFESFLDIHGGPSEIWAGCPEDKADSKNNQPVLPSWLRNLLIAQVAELKQTFTNALVQPSSIREKYLAALKAHRIKDHWTVKAGCTFCYGVHVRQGEDYCAELERKLKHARNKVFVQERGRPAAVPRSGDDNI